MLTRMLLWPIAASLALPAPTPSNSTNRIPESCPDYTQYSNTTHAPFSSGPLALPYMRPSPECRTFNSSAVDDKIAELVPRFKDADLARIFENALPNTLDTTIRYLGEELAFIVTGDINAEFRDSYNQLKAYADFIPQDEGLTQLFRKAIALQARYFTEFPFCNSFQPPVESGIAPENVTDSDCQYVEPSCTNRTVFTCNYEADSFGAFQALSSLYHEKTGDTSFVTDTWTQALEKQLEIMEAEQPPTLDDQGYIDSALNFTRDGNVVVNDGIGPPQLYTGMVGTAFRPSDDRVTYRFHIPDNAMLAVTLQNIVPLLSNRSINSSTELASRARHLSQQIRNGIEEYGVVDHPRWGKVYAYEVDGYGSHNLMDDANVPSLLSLPYLGYCGTDETVYQNTRKMILSPQGNPYYNFGEDGAAIGSPHTWIQHVWPMSLVSQIYTTDDDEEIAKALAMLTNTTSGLGLMHESFYVHNSTQFTRQWFAWANSYFGQCILDLADRKPGLLFADAD